MLATLDMADYAEMRAFERMHPFLAERIDLAAAMICYTFVAAAGVEPGDFADYVPDYTQPAEEKDEISDEDFERKFNLIAKALVERDRIKAKLKEQADGTDRKPAGKSGDADSRV